MDLLLSNTICLLVLAFVFYLMVKFAKRFQRIDLIFGTLLAFFSGFYKNFAPKHYAELGFPIGYVQVYKFDIYPSFNFNVIAFTFDVLIWTLLIRVFRYVTSKIRSINKEKTQSE